MPVLYYPIAPVAVFFRGHHETNNKYTRKHWQLCGIQATVLEIQFKISLQMSKCGHFSLIPVFLQMSYVLQAH